MFDELEDEAEDTEPEKRVTIDESDNEDDWRNDLQLSESSEEDDNGKEEPKPVRQEQNTEAKHARVLPSAKCDNPLRRAEMDGKKAKTYADRAKKGTQPTALLVICSSAKREARAGGIAAAHATGRSNDVERRRSDDKNDDNDKRDSTGHQASERVGNATERAVTSGLDGLTGRMGRDVACALSRDVEVESRYKRMGTALRESVAQFAQRAQMMAEAAKRMGDELKATLTDMAVIQGQQSRTEAARIDGTRLRLAVMRRDIARPPGVSSEATTSGARGREKK
uniref:Uncharacterized protein n=1 Tax=Globodera pallida TaxID=36090 RepID=A0A183BJX6_GLOPA